jgi:hypothetical protein
VVRAGNQIDRSVNPSQIGGGALSGPARPSARFEDASLWAQSIVIGLAIRK